MCSGLISRLYATTGDVIKGKSIAVSQITSTRIYDTDSRSERKMRVDYSLSVFPSLSLSLFCPESNVTLHIAELRTVAHTDPIFLSLDLPPRDSFARRKERVTVQCISIGLRAHTQRLSFSSYPLPDRLQEISFYFHAWQSSQLENFMKSNENSWLRPVLIGIWSFYADKRLIIRRIHCRLEIFFPGNQSKRRKKFRSI